MNTTAALSRLILVPGHWLGAWAWDEVLPHLSTAHAIAVTLPGLDPHDAARSRRTLEEQVAAILDLVADSAEPATLVAHSGANVPVSVVLDRHPELVRQVVWVDSGPMLAGTAFTADLPPEVDDLPLPPFDALGLQASLEGLSTDVLDRFRRKAVPEPGPVLRASVPLSNDARHDVLTTLVCCSLPSAQVRELADAGHPMFAAVAKLTRVEYIDLPTGHWPMWSRPRDLAEVLLSAARES